MRLLKLVRQTVLRLLALAVLLLSVLCAPAWAQNDAAKAEMEAAMKEAQAAQVMGPAEVKMRDQAVLKLPKGQVYVPMPAAGKLMRAMGNRTDDRLIGVIFPDSNEQWMVVAKYESSGYIKDDDARDWKADELLDNLKSGTEQANSERRSRGIPEMEVLGWVEKPAYDAARHRLVWSISSKDKGAPGGGQGVNYNTYALGREGYISMNLVTGLKEIEAHKPVARELLAALDFNSGKRYADFNSSTDKVAEYGLAALVGGIAAKKLGLFAIIAAFFAKFFKVFIIAAIAAVPFLGKLFKKKQPEPVVGTTPGETVFAADTGGAFPNSRAPKVDPFAPTQTMEDANFPATRPLEPVDPFPATRPLEIDPVPPAPYVAEPIPFNVEVTQPLAPAPGTVPPAVPPGGKPPKT